MGDDCSSHPEVVACHQDRARVIISNLFNLFSIKDKIGLVKEERAVLTSSEKLFGSLVPQVEKNFDLHRKILH